MELEALYMTEHGEISPSMAWSLSNAFYLFSGARWSRVLAKDKETDFLV